MSDWLPLIESIAEGMQDAIAVLDSDLKAIYINTCFAKLAGFRKKQLRKELEEGKNIFDFLSRSKDEDLRYAKQCIESKKKILFAEVKVTNSFDDLYTAHQSFFPLSNIDGDTVGVIVVYRDVTDEKILQDQYRILIEKEKKRAETLESMVEERTQQLQKALDDVVHLSRTDPLTGLLNRRAFHEAAEKAMSSAKRKERDYALLMCDLDHFKKLNDTYGHQAGDTVLVEVSKVLLESVRNEDIVCRFGGEEFIILLPETDMQGAKITAERCLTKVRELPIEKLVPGKTEPQTMSMGIALFQNKTENIDELVLSADEALYKAKESGRNQFVIAG